MQHNTSWYAGPQLGPVLRLLCRTISNNDEADRRRSGARLLHGGALFMRHKGINVADRRSVNSTSFLLSRAMSSSARYTTGRLAVVPWRTPLSAAELRELDGILDTEVTAFLPPHLLYEPGTSDVSKWASTFSAGESAVSSVRLLGTNELCGLILLRPETSSVHLGYIFGKQHWGKGLATELLRGLMDQLRVERHVGEIHAGVDRHNPASAAVLRKVGFSAMGAGANGDKPTDMGWYCRKFDGK